MKFVHRLARGLGFAGVEIELTSPLPLGECCSRLRAAMSPSVRLLIAGPVIGSVIGVRFWAHKHIGYRNSFQTYLSGELIEEGERTRIHCRFLMHPFVIAVLTAFFSFALFKCAELAIKGQFDVGPPILLIFGYAIVCIGRLFAQGEQQFLIDFLQSVVDAREMQTGHGKQPAFARFPAE